VTIPGEEALLDRVTAVLCVSGVVYERHRARYGERVHFVPVACDFERYHAELERPLLEQPSRPRIGYAGWINQRLDVPLLLDVARAHRHAELMLAGPVKEPRPAGLRELAREPNVVLLGPQPPERVPAVMRTFDVALIPYRDDDFNRGSNPVKFYEYLALGRPVVATDIPVLRRFGDVASIVRRDEFVAHVSAALDDPGTLFDARVQVAREHSFPVLVERLGSLPL
jgi:glycosyltransferase involved in cell wall biosynthesis